MHEEVSFVFDDVDEADQSHSARDEVIHPRGVEDNAEGCEKCNDSTPRGFLLKFE